MEYKIGDRVTFVSGPTNIGAGEGRTRTVRVDKRLTIAQGPSFVGHDVDTDQLVWGLDAEITAVNVMPCPIVIEVDHGMIEVDQIRLIIDKPYVKIYEIGLGSKYPGPPITGVSGAALSVLLPPSERTLYTRKGADPRDVTEVSFSGDCLDLNWRIMANASKWSIHVALYRHDPDSSQVVWLAPPA